MKKNNLKAQRKEIIKNRPISTREIELSHTLWQSKVILGSEDLMWRSEVYDDTDSVIKSVLDLTKSCIELNVKIVESKQLHDELSLHNEMHNLELKTDAFLTFCSSLRDTEISKMADEVENKLNAYVFKWL